MEISVRKSVRRPIYSRAGEDPWARVCDILLDKNGERVVALVAATESLVPLKRLVPFGEISFERGVFYARAAIGGLSLPPGEPRSCLNDFFRLKSAGGTGIRDIAFDAECGYVSSVTVGGFFGRQKITLIRQDNNTLTTGDD